MSKKKLIRVATLPASLCVLLKGQLNFMSSHYDVRAVSSEGKLKGVIERDEGVQTHYVSMTRTISPFKDLWAVFKLYKYFKEEKPFIVHTHTPKAGTLGMLAARLAGVPHRLHTIAGLPLLEATGSKRRLLNFVEKITYANANLILPNSFGLLEIIKQHNFTSLNKLKVIANGSSNGIDTEHFKPSVVTEEKKKSLKKELGIKDTDFVFVFLGRIVADKGINELIAAFNHIANQNKSLKLLLVGGYEVKLDPLNPETTKAINSQENIITTGWVTDVRPYFSISDCLVFPSYREGFPNVVLQACAMELPSIVTDINGCNEIIEHHKNGLIVKPKSTKELVQAMLFILDNPDTAKAFSEKTRPIILKNYKREVIWEELLKLYQSFED